MLMSIQLFLAHASEDKPAVLDLYERLKTKGYNPWIDKKNLIPGQNWREEIPKAIRHSQIFIACLSQHFVSKQGYIRKEFRLALDAYAEKPSDSIYLIPLKLEACEIPDLRLESLGVSLRDLHWVDYWEPDGFENLVRAIEFKISQLQVCESDTAIPSTNSPQPMNSSPSGNRVLDNAPHRDPKRLVSLSQHQSIKFSTLENYLKLRKWKEADQETNEILGNGKSIRIEDIEAISCGDWLLIDKLWAKSSDNHFGFYSQTRVWHEAGENNEIFNEMVGWKKIGKWISYGELIFDISAPKGHLPTLWTSTKAFGGFHKYLFARFRVCYKKP